MAAVKPAFGMDLGSAMLAEQVRLLARQRFDLPINLINAGIVAATLLDFYPRWVAAAWGGVFCCVILARFLMRRHYRLAVPGAEMVRRWSRVFTGAAFATGCLWGLTGSIVLLTPDPIYNVFIVFVLGGMMAGGIVSNAAYLPAMLAYLLPTVLPAIVLLGSRGDVVGIEMSVMLALFTAVLALAGRNINRSITQNFRLRLEQDILLPRLRASEAAMVEAQAVAQIGSWEFDVAAGSSTWSAEVFRILGVEPAITQPAYDAIVARTHPDDRARIERFHLDSLASPAVGVTDHRIVMDDGAIKWVHALCRSLRDADGRVLRLNGTLQDITDRRQAADELAYRNRLLHAVTVGTGMLIKAESLRKGMPEALRILGESMQVNRVLVIREHRQPGAVPMLRHAWQAPGVRVPLDALPIPATSAFSASLAAWRTPLGKGEPVIGHLATSAGALQTLLDRAPKQSTLMVPIFVVDRLWGNLAVDAGSTARQWTVSDVDILNTFADITGSLIQRSQSGRALERSEERFRVLGATAQDAIIHVDGAGRIGSWNRAAERILGYTAQEAVGRQVQELLAPTRFREASDRAMVLFRSTGQSGAIGKTRELIARRKDGTEIAVELSIAGAWLGGGWEAIGILRDITQRRSAEDELQFANLLLRTQMEASPDGILIVDAKMKIVSFNQRFVDMWNVPPAQMVVGADSAVLPSVVALVKDPATFLARVGYLYGHPGEDSSEELETTDGRSIDRHSVTLHSPAGKYLARAWFFRDVSARKQAAAQALRLARFDSLTGLANRSVFVEVLQQAIASAKRGEKGLAVLYLDLDHFKDVNDTLGHPVGDELLKAVAERMRSVSRETDTVARFGGDEFAVIVAATADPAAAAILADKLIKALAEPFAVLGNTLRTGASIGIATWGPDALDAETLLSHADVALYRAKSDGRGSYRFFTDAMNAEVRSRVLLGAELRNAIDADQLFLMYQPQIEVDGGRISAVEALLRWRHPRLGVLEPEVFMPVAGQIGLVVQLGHWVIWEACRQARIWRDAGMAPQRISIKVMALQFRDSMAFETDIAAALAATGTPPDMLELELTDMMLMQVSRDHGQILERLRNAGVTIAVGDFGTGYSSLEYLQHFPRNRIKIASNSISKIDSLPGDAMIVKASIGLARDLGIMVVAAGVDTLGQFDLLKRWGCSVVQGKHLAGPLSTEAATQLLRKGAGPRIDAAPGHET